MFFPFCLDPIFTAGTPKKEHSLIATLELPTIHLDFINTFKKSSGEKFFTKSIFLGLIFSLNFLISFEIISLPASTLGHSHIVGKFKFVLIL